jgi:predicted lactoylglutathione lyase
MVWGESIIVMIMTFEQFKFFATKPLADSKNNLAGLFSLSVESVERINEIVDKAIRSGGTEPKPIQD